MASNYKRRSSSSVSRRSALSTRQTTRQVSSRQNGSYASARSGRDAGGRASGRTSGRDAYVTRTVGEINRGQRRDQRRQTGRRISGNVIAVVIIIAVVLIGAFAVYLAPIAKIQHISIKGAEHLTNEEMIALAEIPDDTTLLRVDTTRIEQNCLRDAWIKSVAVNRVFPDTLELVVTERKIAATVAVPTGNSAVTRVWAIAQDKTWLMPIPDKESQAAATVSEQVYIDA